MLLASLFLSGLLTKDIEEDRAFVFFMFVMVIFFALVIMISLVAYYLQGGQRFPDVM